MESLRLTDIKYTACALWPRSLASYIPKGVGRRVVAKGERKGKKFQKMASAMLSSVLEWKHLQAETRNRKRFREGERGEGEEEEAQRGVYERGAGGERKKRQPRVREREERSETRMKKSDDGSTGRYIWQKLHGERHCVACTREGAFVPRFPRGGARARFSSPQVK